MDPPVCSILGADPHAANQAGWTPLDCAVHGAHAQAAHIIALYIESLPSAPPPSALVAGTASASDSAVGHGVGTLLHPNQVADGAAGPLRTDSLSAVGDSLGRKSALQSSRTSSQYRHQAQTHLARNVPSSVTREGADLGC